MSGWIPGDGPGPSTAEIAFGIGLILTAAGAGPVCSSVAAAVSGRNCPIGPAGGLGARRHRNPPAGCVPCGQLALQVSGGVAAAPFAWKPNVVEPEGAIAPL